MIFNSNTTSLGANTTIPMAEGYDAHCGVGLALVESARNDYSMFKAMIQADYKELAICKESTGVVMEGEIAALHEAVGGGIFKKIVELFKKLVAKIKSIFHNFAARLQGLFGKDADLVKKYQTEVLRKSNINKLEVKWRKKADNFDSVAFDLIDPTAFDGYAKAKGENKDIEGWAEDSWERVQFFLKKSGIEKCESTSEVVTEFVNKNFADEDTLTIGDVGGVRAICDFLSGYSKKFDTMQKNINKSTTNLEKIVKSYNDKASEVAEKSNDKGVANVDGKFVSINQANHIYDMAVAYQTAVLAIMQATTDCAKIDYKQNKAAFMKAVTVSEKKLEESTLLAAVAEAAEEEVEEVLAGALEKEEISDVSAASTNVKDADVSDDPDKLTYGPDQYTANAKFDGPVDGEIDTDPNSKDCKEESAFFGKLFY